MGTVALGRDEEQDVSARFSLVAADHAEFKRLCRPSPFIPHIPDSICCVFRSTARSEDLVCNLRRTCSAVVLLAFAQVSHPFSAGMVNRASGLRAAVPVSDEHG